MLKNALIFFLIIGFTIFFVYRMNAQNIIPLYSGTIPGSKPNIDREMSGNNEDGIWIVSKVSRPTLTVFLPPKEKATGAAVIICPGGGYTNLAMGYEGVDVAQKFNASGIAAFVLKYRIPNDSTMVEKEIGPLQDAQRAIQILRSRAAEWGINPHRVGIMGFSAGGHLASTAGTHFQTDYIPNPENINLRPDFMLLIYPVISFKKEIAHAGSAENLLGPAPSPDRINKFSNETQITDNTPPAFLVHAKDDNVVPYANSTSFADSLKKHHISFEIFLYDQGGHGFGMTNKTSSRSWMDACINWMKNLHSE